MMHNGSFFVETEHDVNVIDIQTHSVFVDIRIPTSRDALVRRVRRVGGVDVPAARSFADLSLPQLQLLAGNHCFAGFSIVDYDLPGVSRPPAPQDVLCPRSHHSNRSLAGGVPLELELVV
jgi:hypothetical protein